MLNQIIKIIIPIALIFAGFVYHPLAGVLLIILFLAFLVYNARATIYMSMSNASFQNGDLERAKEKMEQARKADPKNVQVALSYGYLCLRMGDIETAERIYNKIEELKLDQHKLGRQLDMQLKINKSIVLWKKGRQQESIELAAAVHEQFKNTVLYGTLGYYYILNGDLEKALAYNLEAYDYNDSNPSILDNLGLTYYRLGEKEKALEIYQKLMGLDPKFPEAFYNYATLLEEQGDREKALENYKKALEFRDSIVSHTSKEEIQAKIAELSVNE